MLPFALVLIASFLITLAATPLVRSFALRSGIVERHPKQLEPRPRAGGTVVLLSTLVVGVVGALRIDWASIEVSAVTPFVGLLTAMVFLWLLGLADDIWSLRGRQKLLGQVVIATGLIFCGFRIDIVSLPGGPVELGWIAFPATLLWLITTTNALNLLEESDGLIPIMGAIISISLGVMVGSTGNYSEAVIALSMGGALLGFLVFNFPPAKILLGDSGTLVVGMVCGAIALRCSVKGPTSLALLAPLAIFALPILDSALALIRRRLSGRSLYTYDAAHLVDTLKGKGFGERSVLLLVTVMSLVTSGSALLGFMLGQEWIGLLCVTAVCAVLVVTRSFGYFELSLIARRCKVFAASFLERTGPDKQSSLRKGFRVQGTRQWELIWDQLTRFASEEGLSKVRFDLEVPWLEEGFHGSWQNSPLPDKQERWSANLPVYGLGQVAGRIEAIGPATGSDSVLASLRLASLVEELTPQVELLLSSSDKEVWASQRDETPLEMAVLD